MKSFNPTPFSHFKYIENWTFTNFLKIPLQKNVQTFCILKSGSSLNFVYVNHPRKNKNAIPF